MKLKEISLKHEKNFFVKYAVHFIASIKQVAILFIRGWHQPLYANKNLRSLETVKNDELLKIVDWLIANKLSLNVKKTNYIIFHPYQKHLNYDVNI